MSATTAVGIDPTANWEAYKRLVYRTAYDFADRHNTDRPDTLAEAEYAYCRACRGFDPAQGYKFSTYLVLCVRRWLSRWNAGRLRAAARELLSETGDEFQIPSRREFDLDRLSRHLSIAAREAIRLLFDPTPEVRFFGRTRKRLREEIRNHLGMDGRDFDRVRTEIMEALAS